MQTFTKTVSIIGMALWLAISPVRAADYQVGERLPKEVAVQPGAPYRPLNWDELIPADWDPTKPLKGLNMDKLQDSDPRAIEALEKVRAAWNDAPIIGSLNNQRVEIPGFVVPLDVDSERVKEFLLVPYFGACIHVPPPPSNQVIHVIPPKGMSKEQQKILKKAVLTYGAVSVSGTLETVSSNTAMGFSGYRLKADKIAAYQAPDKNRE